jgi:hypothetical protein
MSRSSFWARVFFCSFVVLAFNSVIWAQQLANISIVAPDRDYHYTNPPAPTKSARFNIPGKGWLRVEYIIDPWPGGYLPGGGQTWANTGKSNEFAGPGENCRLIEESPTPKVAGKKYRIVSECWVLGPMTGVDVRLTPMHVQTWTEGGHQVAGSQSVTVSFSGEGGPETLIFQHFTNAAVKVGWPTQPSTFTLDKSYTISQIRTYHWNNGRGTQTPGVISIKGPDGKVYGPWKASGSPGQGGISNVHWIALPDLTLPPGTYQVVDSDPSTWSHNSDTHGAGIIWVYGSAAMQL